MIVSIIDVSEKLKHALNTHIVEQYSLMNSDTSSVSVDDDYYNNNKQVLGGEKRSELNGMLHLYFVDIFKIHIRIYCLLV
ncbi:unnamed protein product [Trichobilharzia regenti]|nr:unnamed protein product [Trichobilharzia regenti]